MDTTDTSTDIQALISNSFTKLNFTNGLSTADILIVLLTTFVMGMFIFYMYKKTFQGVLYTQSYNVSLVMVALVTSLIIMTISTNFILSLGMVGALSIVRFRTAIKDSMDIVFMFWAISVGIANGAGIFKISLIGSIVIGLVLFVLTKMRSSSAPYLLILNYNEEAHKTVIEYIQNNVGKFNLKSKTVVNDNVELSIEIRLENDNNSFVNTLSKKEGVQSAVLVSYNGDYIS